MDRLNRNSLVSLATDDISADKIRINAHANPNPLFLVPTNTTVNHINQHVIGTLFEKERPIGEVTNALMLPMKIYKNITFIITENRYIFFPMFLSNLSMYIP